MCPLVCCEAFSDMSFRYAPTPKDLIVGITNDNADVGSKTLAVDDALVVYHMLQVHFPDRSNIKARD